MLTKCSIKSPKTASQNHLGDPIHKTPIIFAVFSADHALLKGLRLLLQAMSLWFPCPYAGVVDGALGPQEAVRVLTAISVAFHASCWLRLSCFGKVNLRLDRHAEGMSGKGRRHDHH
jgi:hypothetical protein